MRSSLELIDTILIVLNGIYYPEILYDNFIPTLYKNHRVLFEEDDRFKHKVLAILDKLEKDKFISYESIFEKISKTPSTVRYISITFEGQMFIEAGGYRGRLNREIAENIRLGNIEKRQKAYERQMTYLTIILAISASFAVPYYILEISKHKNFLLFLPFWTALFSFLCVGIASVIIYLLVREIKGQKK